MPPTTRNKPNIQMLAARPVPKALIRNSNAAIFITDSRPILSASRPATTAPSAAPISAAATAKPVTQLADLEVVLNGRYGAVDDRAVVAEQQPAEGGYRCDSDDAAAVLGFFVIQS